MKYAIRMYGIRSLEVSSTDRVKGIPKRTGLYFDVYYSRDGRV